MKKASARNTQVARPRGRPRSFDREAVLDRAMEVFWAKGFEGTSLNDLTKAMGINPPSLYAAFGDKERLFLEAVERYQAKRGPSNCPYAEEPTARGAIEQLLSWAAKELCSDCHPRGCMMVMAATTTSASSKQMQAALAERRVNARARMKARIDQGLKAGELPAGTDTGALADFYSTVLTGMSLQAREGASRKSLLATVAAAMRAWPASAKRAPRVAKGKVEVKVKHANSVGTGHDIPIA
jgi:TetR/AcrR family transcriptional regulator, copper-responsive repressor